MLKLASSKFSYYTFHDQEVNSICADQAARMRRIVCAFVVRLQQNQGFSRRGQCIPFGGGGGGGKSYCFKHTAEWRKSKLGGVL